MKRTFSFLVPTVWASAVPRLIYHALQFVPMVVGTEDCLLVVRWCSMCYYVSFLVLPIIVTKKNKQIRKNMDDFVGRVQILLKLKRSTRSSTELHIESEDEQAASVKDVSRPEHFVQTRSGKRVVPKNIQSMEMRFSNLQQRYMDT